MNRLFLVFLISSLLIPAGILESDALRQSGGYINFEIAPGETKTFTWSLISEKDFPTTLKISSLTWGSQFISHPSTVDVEANGSVTVEFTVTIPEDHPGDVVLNPKIRGQEIPDESASGVLINIVMQTIPTITITKNPNSEYWTNTAYDEPESPVAVQEEQVMKEETGEEQPTMMLIAPEEESTKEEASTPEQVSVESEEGGGCLIATATYGSEMAQQVQLLREIRDTKLLSTSSGTSFMTGFNSLYYSFSPTIADLERQNPIFKEAVKLTITPLITSLSILSYVDIDSEAEVLSYGISLILLNIGMYFVAPAVLIRTALMFKRK